MVSTISLRYRPGGEAATRLLVDYLNSCPHGEGKALARLPSGRLVCWACYLDAFFAHGEREKEAPNDRP